jgi:hypothetical protein
MYRGNHKFSSRWKFGFRVLKRLFNRKRDFVVWNRYCSQGAL